jgi:3-deoxy-manno-octulosonate cytidylyltransferase (CMP-KDO synthetase)
MRPRLDPRKVLRHRPGVASVVAIIPARWASVRFPGKPLVLIFGKSLLQHTWEQCQKAKTIDGVIVATDDMRIAEAAFDFGAEVALTSPRHPSGTDRLAEVAAMLGGVSHLINVQGDEPTIDPRLIDRLAGAMLADPKIDMITAASPFSDPAAASDPNHVKVVVDLHSNALYFSRAPIPYDRDAIRAARPLHHMGIYGYRRRFLLEFVQWKPSPLEKTERLEQLRALENGASVRVIVAKRHSIGVDMPEDVARVEALLAGRRR